MFANVSNESYTFLRIESIKLQKLGRITPYSIENVHILKHSSTPICLFSPTYDWFVDEPWIQIPRFFHILIILEE